MKTPDSLGWKRSYWPQVVERTMRQSHWSFDEGKRTRAKKASPSAVALALEMLLGKER